MELARRVLVGKDSRFKAMDEAGGLYVVPPEPDWELVRRGVLEEGIRALEVQAHDLTFLAGLPLEFLNLNVAMPRIEPVNTLERLRGLGVDAWTGDLDCGALPNLEWLAAGEVEPGQLQGLFERGHERLHHLNIGKYREPDLSPLSKLTALTHLSVGDSRALSRLMGVEALPRLRYLEVYSCRALTTLAGIHAAATLQHLEISRCNQVGGLEPVAALPALRSLQIGGDRPPPLAPLVGHPTLEFLWLVCGRKPGADDVAALQENPTLRFLSSARSEWLRPESEWFEIRDIYTMTEEAAELRERILEERDLFAMW